MRHLILLSLIVGSAVLGLAQPVEEEGHRDFPFGRTLDWTSDDTCEACERYYEIAQKLLTDPVHVNLTRKSLEQICDSLRSVHLDEVCLGFVADSLPKIVEYIKNTKPNQFCKAIALCNSTSVSPPVSKGDELEENDLLRGNPLLKVDNEICQVCKQDFEKLQQKFEDPAVMIQTLKYLKRVCDYLRFSGLNKECFGSVEKYLSQFEDYIKSTKPDQFCKAINVCG